MSDPAGSKNWDGWANWNNSDGWNRQTDWNNSAGRDGLARQTGWSSAKLWMNQDAEPALPDHGDDDGFASAKSGDQSPDPSTEDKEKEHPRSRG